MQHRLTGYVPTLVESLVPGLIVDEILPGSTGPVARNVVCTTASSKNYPKTKDKLLISILSASGIQPCDFLSGSADPYVTVSQISGKKAVATKRTKTIKNHLTPKWEDPPFEFKLDPEIEQTFVFKVMDEDIGIDEVLGFFELNAHDIVSEMNSNNCNYYVQDIPAKKESKQKTIKVKVSFTLERSTSIPPKNLDGRLQFIDLDICWDPCYLQVKVRYTMGITLEVTAKISKLILPARVVLEWKACPAETVPTLGNIKNFPANFPKESGGRILKNDFEILLEASKYFSSTPNMDRVWICLTTKPIVSIDITSTVGDVEKLLKSFGNLDIDSTVSDAIYGVFPMCVYDATKTSSAEARKGTAQGDLAALLDPVNAGSCQRQAKIHMLLQRAELSEIRNCYCMVRIDNIDPAGLNAGAYPNPENCMITHATWSSGVPIFMNHRSWRITDLSRQKISIELWAKVSESEADQLIGSEEMHMMDFISKYTIHHDKPAKILDVDLMNGNRLFIRAHITTTKQKNLATDQSNGDTTGVGGIKLIQWLHSQEHFLGPPKACRGSLLVRGQYVDLHSEDQAKKKIKTDMVKLTVFPGSRAESIVTKSTRTKSQNSLANQKVISRTLLVLGT